MSTVQDATGPQGGRFTPQSLFCAAFGSGPRWLAWLVDTVSASLDLNAAEREILALRQHEVSLRSIAPRVGVSHRQAERWSGSILSRARERGCASVPGVALRAVETTQSPTIRVAIRDVDPPRCAAWRGALEELGPGAVHTSDFEAADVAICSPWLPGWQGRCETGRVVVLSSPDAAGRLVCANDPTRMYADPDHDDLPLVLAHAIVGAVRLQQPGAGPQWPLPATWLRRSLLAHVVESAKLGNRAREVIDAWIDAGDQKTIARCLHLSTRAVESRASLVCAALRVRTLAGVPLGAANAMEDSTRLREPLAGRRRPGIPDHSSTARGSWDSGPHE